MTELTDTLFVGGPWHNRIVGIQRTDVFEVPLPTKVSYLAESSGTYDPIPRARYERQEMYWVIRDRGFTPRSFDVMIVGGENWVLDLDDVLRYTVGLICIFTMR